jgi:ribose transport system permease protein
MADKAPLTDESQLPKKPNWKQFFQGQTIGILGILIVMVVFLSLFTNTFFTSTNIFNILRAFSWIAIAAFGECMVIITGGIDLSVGSVMGLTGLISSMLMVAGIPIPLAILIGLAAGAAAGFINGLMITKTFLPPFIATLSMLYMARGLCTTLTGAWPVRDMPESFDVLGQYDLPFVGIPMPLIFVIIFALITGFFLKRTVWGYHVYAVGGNEAAAKLSGVNTNKVKIMVYTGSALLAAVAGIIMTSRLGVASPTAAQGYELDVIAAAVVGGTSLSGGEGTIFGVLLGAAIMQVLRTGLVLTGVNANLLQFVQGLIIAAAVMVDQLRKRRR